MTIAPLMRRYSPFRISALVLAIGWIPLAVAGAGQIYEPDASSSARGRGSASPTPSSARCSSRTSSGSRRSSRVGPSRASLFANLQPFFAVLFALLILGEHLNRWEIVGAVAIVAGIVLERARRRRPALTAGD